jgi:hypothetical protein
MQLDFERNFRSKNHFHVCQDPVSVFERLEAEGSQHECKNDLEFCKSEPLSNTITRTCFDVRFERLEQKRTDLLETRDPSQGEIHQESVRVRRGRNRIRDESTKTTHYEGCERIIRDSVKRLENVK